MASPSSLSCVPPVLSHLAGKLQWESGMQGPCLAVVISLSSRYVIVIFPCWHYPAKVAWRGRPLLSALPTSFLKGWRPGRWSRGLGSQGWESHSLGPSSLSLHALHTTHVLTYTDAQRNGISSLDREKGMYIEAHNSQKNNSAWPHSQGPASLVSSRPESTPSLFWPTAQPSCSAASRNHPLGAGCTLARLKGQGVKGPREEKRERRPSLSPPPPPPPQADPWDRSVSAKAKALWGQKLSSFYSCIG